MYAATDAAIPREVYVRLSDDGHAVTSLLHGSAGGSSDSGDSGSSNNDSDNVDESDDSSDPVAVAAADALEPATTNSVPGGGGSSATPQSVHKSIAREWMPIILQCFEEGQDEIELPAWVSIQQRHLLHNWAEELGMSAKSHGVGPDRKLTVSAGSCDIAVLKGNWTSGAGSSVAAAAAAVDPDQNLLDEAIAGIDPGWKDQLLSYDPRHWMALFFGMCRTNSAIFPYFASCVSDALFQICDGEVERVSDWLVNSRGFERSSLNLITRKYWRDHCRRKLDEPKVPITNLHRLVMVFKQARETDEKRQSFFKHDWRTHWKKMIKFVQVGQLSDPPGVPMYLLIRPARAAVTDASGKVVKRAKLAVYRNRRTQSGGEGSHLERRLVINPKAAAMSPRYFDAIMNHHDWRTVLKQGRVVGIYDNSLPHDRLELLDELQSLINSVLRHVPAANRERERARHVLASHRATRLGADGKPHPILHYGNYYALGAMRSEISPGGAPGSGLSLGTRAVASTWLATELDVAGNDGGGGGGVKWHVAPTREDVQALSTTELRKDPVSLASAARERHLLWTAKDAEKFIADSAECAAVHTELARHDFHTVQKEIRSQRAVQQPAEQEDDTIHSLIPPIPASAAPAAAPAPAQIVRAAIDPPAEQPEAKKQRKAAAATARAAEMDERRRKKLWQSGSGLPVTVKPRGAGKYDAVLDKEENSGLFRTQGSRGDFRAALSLISAHFTHVSVKRTVGGAKEVVRLVTVSCPNGWSL